MSKYPIQAVVLAAGKSTRFNTGNSKLLEKLCGKEIILYSTKLLKEELDIPASFVVGYQAEQIKDIINKNYQSCTFVLQSEPKGTGDALLQTKSIWNNEHILVMNGDMPLVTKDIIEKLIEKHLQQKAAISFVTAHHSQPITTGYGRVIKEENSIQIIEAKDLKNENHESCCINAGIYLFKRDFLEKNLHILTNNNASREFYITDLIKHASDQELTVETISASFDHIRGINTLKELWIAEQIKRSELISYWMEQGIRFDVAQSTHVDIDVSLGAGTSIGAGVHILNGTTIGQNCRIEPFCIIDNAVVGNHVFIRSHSILNNVTCENNTEIGPFAHLKNKSIIRESAKIGNFVEVNRSIVGNESKAKHLAYLGDAHIGSNTNIGAGTVICNYDGKEKHKTIIENNVFVGSNNTLVAPITIEKNSYTAAGSTITDNVEKESLAIGRARQINKEGYAKKLTKPNDEEKKNNTENNESYAFFGAIKADTDILENL